MINSQEQIQIFYEIALSIGNGRNLNESATKTISTFLRKLNCFAGAVYQMENLMEKCWYKQVASIPIKIDRNAYFNQLLIDFTTSPDECVKPSFTQSFPIIKHCEQGIYAYIFKLSDYGIFIVLKKENPLSDELIMALEPLTKKFGDSLTSFLNKEKLFIHSEALEASSNAILISDSEGHIQWVNKAWCKLNGFTVGESVGQYSNLIKSDFNNPETFDEMWKTIVGGKVWTGSLINKRKDGTLYNSEITITPVKDDTGETKHYIAISQDITTRKLAEEALKESKERFEEMANLLPQPIWEINLEGKLTYANKAGFQIFGYSQEDFENGINFIEVVSEEERPRILSIFKKKMIGEKLGDNEFICLRKNGETFPGMIFSSPIYKRNNVIGIRGIVLDVTNLKLTQERLERISSLQDVLIKISTQYINISTEKMVSAINIALEEMGRFVDADRAYIFDYDFEKQITRNTFEWCREGIEPQIDELQEVPIEAIPQWVDSHLKGQPVYVADVLSLPEDDDLRAVLEPQDIKSLIAVPMADEKECIGFLGFDSVRQHHSYTEKEKSILEVFAQIVVNLQNRAKAEYQLKLAKEKAEKAEQAQFEFLSTMSHEIRTPLNAVVGLTNILLMESPKEEQLENLNTLKFSSQNLLSIINDILDYNKLLSGNVALEFHDFSLTDLLNGMYLSMSSLASAKNISLDYEIEDDTPEVLIGDSTRLLQVINNLVSNAIKFTKDGYVKIVINKKGMNEDKHIIEFSIQDTGIGIPNDKFETIFEEFKQTSSSITREYGGTGLGLPIVKKLLKVMGSEIKLESEIGKGTRFSFKVEFEEGDKSKISPKDFVVKFDQSLEDIRILLVEDNRINQMVAIKFLHEWKCKVDAVENGQAALERLENHEYDVILMDLHMPVMDGYTTTKHIRENSNERISKTPIIALSASALGEVAAKAKAYGMEEFITKPFKPTDLFKALIRQTLIRREHLYKPNRNINF